MPPKNKIYSTRRRASALCSLFFAELVSIWAEKYSGITQLLVKFNLNGILSHKLHAVPRVITLLHSLQNA